MGGLTHIFSEIWWFSTSWTALAVALSSLLLLHVGTFLCWELKDKIYNHMMGTRLSIFDPDSNTAGWTVRQLKALYRGAVSFFLRNLLSVMEDQAGLKLFSLDAPKRYSGVASTIRTFPAHSFEGDIPANARGSVGVSPGADDAPMPCVAEDELSSHDSCEGLDADDCSQSALWRRWSTFTRLDVSKLEEETLHELCLCTNLFACMDADQAKELYKLGSRIRMSPGEVLIEQGDDVTPGVFVVIAGQMRVYSSYCSAKSQYVKHIGKGGVVAEDHIDLILDRKGTGKYCASVCVADTPQCELLQLSQSTLCSFFSSHPGALHRYIEDVMVCRYSVSNTVLRQELKIRQDEVTAGRVASVLSEKQCRLLRAVCDSIVQKSEKLGSLFRGICKSLRGEIFTERLTIKCLETEASPITGWDVIPGATTVLHGLPTNIIVIKSHGIAQFGKDGCFALTKGMLVAVRNSPDNEDEIECALVTEGSLINVATFLTSEPESIFYFAASECTLKRLDKFWLGSLMTNDQNEKSLSKATESLVTLTQPFGPTLRQFEMLGFQEQWLSAGQAVFCQDQAPDGFFMVVSGSMKFLELAVDGSLHEKGLVRRGEWAGTATNKPCKFSCMATKDVELVSLKRDMLQLLSRVQPRAMLLVYDKVMQQLERSVEDCKTCSRTIALISGVMPSSCYAVDELQKDADDFGKSLEHALSGYGSIYRIDWALVVQHFPEDSNRLYIPFCRAKIARWLCAMEEEHTFLLLVGNYTNSEWTTLCSAQADRVLILGSSIKSNPEVSFVENESVWKPAKVAIETLKQTVTRHDVSEWKNPLSSISMILSGRVAAPIASKLHQPQRSVTQNSRESLGSICQIDLVLIHDSGSTPSHASRWLKARPLIERHYNIRKSNHEDVKRIARWVSGNAIGVVLSGGGARGLAHVGVLQALDRLQIPIDAIGGTSQGSLVAALYAQGHSVLSIHKTINSFAAVCGSMLAMMLDLTLPILSVFNGKRFQQAVKTSLSDGAQNIEDLLTSYFCVTTNLSTGEPHVHSRGILWRAVRASMSIVGLVPPIIDENGHLICDGGYSDNLPVDAMRKMGASIIIAVDVEDRDVSAWSNLSMPVEGVLSGWQILWDRWCPIPSWTSGQRFPRQQHMLNALCGMAHSQNLANLARFVQDEHIDLYLRPPVLQYALLDWNFMEDIVSDARSYSITEISRWLKNANLEHFNTSR